MAGSKRGTRLFEGPLCGHVARGGVLCGGLAPSDVARAGRMAVAMCLAFAIASGMTPSAWGFVVFDLVEDYRPGVNSDTSRWSYRYSPTQSRDGNYPLLSDLGPASGSWSPVTPQTWQRPGGVAGFGVNDTGSDVTDTAGPGYVWADATSWLYPASGGYTIVSWLAPSTGDVVFTVSVDNIDDNGGDGIGFFIEIDDAGGNIFSGVSLGNDGAVTLSNFGTSVQAGQRFNVGVTSKADASFDATSLGVTILFDGPIPEPGTAGLLGLGVAGLLRRRGR